MNVAARVASVACEEWHMEVRLVCVCMCVCVRLQDGSGAIDRYELHAALTGTVRQPQCSCY